MSTRGELYSFGMAGKPHSPTNSERMSARIDAYRSEVLAEAADELVRIATTLAARVAAHMTAISSDTTPTAGWTVARDRRDETAVVVWRTGTDGPVQPQVRGMVLYRWLCSLRDAGFTGDARTDMAVFGQPEAQSPDRIARWLHLTGWAAPTTRAGGPLAPLPPAPLRVTVPIPQGRRLVCPLTGLPAAELVFTYRLGGVQIVLHYETAEQDWAQVETEPPGWLVALAEEHRPGECRG